MKSEESDVDELGQIKAIMNYLSKEMKGQIKLGFNGHDQKWFVLVPLGNSDSVARTSLSNDPLTSLRNTLESWKKRSPDNPFI